MYVFSTQCLITNIFSTMHMMFFFAHLTLQVLSEAVDLEKSYDMVYGLRAGGPLDEEILRYMRARGWSERIQVNIACCLYLHCSQSIRT